MSLSFPPPFCFFSSSFLNWSADSRLDAGRAQRFPSQVVVRVQLNVWGLLSGDPDDVYK